MKYALFLLPCLAFAQLPDAAVRPVERVARAIDIAPVWSGHPVLFDLVTHGERQYVAFWDADRNMTIGARLLDHAKWDLVRLPSKIGWDSHNYIVLAVDRDGIIHVSGNMHVNPLVYFRSKRPHDIQSLEKVEAMTGANEARVTYPRFLRNSAGNLLFTYRDGRSGSGDQIYNIYDEKSRSWRRLLDKPLTFGQGRMNAYFHGPVLGPDGYFHLVWTWRDSPDCSTNHDLSYARSKDLVTWESSGGKPFTLPITVETAEIIDAVPVRGGMINNNTRIGFDSKGRVVVTYHKFDAQGNTQLMNARLENGKWNRVPATGWAYRWDFSGGGSIPFEITHGAVTSGMLLDYEHIKYGAGTLVLDEATLKPLRTIARERVKPEARADGMQVNSIRRERYQLRWETLGPNRDRPRTGEPPAPSMLRLYELRGPENTERMYGAIQTDKPEYRPLDEVVLTIAGRQRGDTVARIRVADPLQKTYVEREVTLTNNKGELRFTAAGPLGNHYIYLQWHGEKRHSRYLNFKLDAETAIETGDRDFDTAYDATRKLMLLGRREYETPRGRMVGYMSADTNHFDGIWLRDWIYQLPAYKYWERDMSCGIDRFMEVQRDDGQVADGIERSGKTWRVGLESDVEYILTLAVWQTWKVTGDDKWMEAMLPRLEKAHRYITSDLKHWDASNRLIKRQHSCDTWDYDIDGATDKGLGRHVIATCDQSGYFLAYRAMGAMYRALKREADAARWETLAAEYRDRASKLLWDGTKFLHHVHIDKIDHGDFDERRQLAMGNTWAMTRGFATAEQARSVIDEYKRRHEVTGDAYPWWSLQPGYPDHLGYWKESFRHQGQYANGGLMPWVGGELCRAALLYGREEYGVQLFRQWMDHLRRTGGAQVWYWPNGEPGFRTNNEVANAGWGIAQWFEALVEGLAGIRESDAGMSSITLTPRWRFAGIRQARITIRYPASDRYFAYRYTHDGSAAKIEFSGSGQSINGTPAATHGVLHSADTP